MSIRKSTINDINVTLEPLYLITAPGDNTLISFDNLGNVVNSDIPTSDVADFLNNKTSQILSTVLTDFDYTNSTGYIDTSDTILTALQKSQNQINSIVDSKGAINGIASLDSSGKLSSSQIPASLIGAMVYQGTWNASTNIPTIVSSTGNKGNYYIVSFAGSTNIDGISTWDVNDWIVFDGTTWEKIDNSTVNVLNTPLNGLSTGINTPILSTNTVLTAFQNTQAQINNKANVASGTQNYLPYFSNSNTLSTSLIYHSAVTNNNGSSTVISSNNTATESLTINDFSGNKLVGIRNDGRFIFKSTSIQINDINNTESSAIYIGAGNNIYDTHFYLASRLTGTNDFISFYNTSASLKTFYYDYNSVLNLQSINTTNSTSLLKMYKSDNTQILSFNNNGLVMGVLPQDVSSIIDLQTTSQGLGLPKMLTSQKTSITTTRRGLTVYDDTLKALSFWTGTEWASTLNNTTNGTQSAMPYYDGSNTISNSTLLYAPSSPNLLSLTDTDTTDKTLFAINSFDTTDNLRISHNYTTDKTTHTYNHLNQIVANLSDGDVKIGGTNHISSTSSSSDHISFTDVASNINVWRTSNTGNTFIRTTDNTATNKFFTFTNFGGTQIGYIENGGMVIGSDTRNANLILDLQSITQAIGLPTLTTLAENNISANSRMGMMLYNTTLGKLRYSDGVSWASVVDSSYFSSLTTNYISKWNGTAFVDSLLTSRSGGLTLENATVIDLNTNGKSYFEFYPLIKNTVGAPRFALDIFPSSDTFYPGFVDIIGIKSGGDVQNSKNTLKKAITITHRSTDSTGGNQNAIFIDAQMNRPQVGAVTIAASGVHHITSINADNYTSIVQAGANGSNPIHYSAYSQRDNALGFQHYKDSTQSSGIQNFNRNLLQAGTTTFSTGFGFKIENFILTSNASTYVSFDDEIIVANVGTGTTTTGRRFRHMNYVNGTPNTYIAGFYASGVTIGDTTALPNTATQLDLVGTTIGLGLNLVPTASLPTAITRKGNLLFDSTANILKVSNGTTWLDVTTGSLTGYVDLTSSQTISGQKTFTTNGGNSFTGTGTGTIISNLDCSKMISGGRYIFNVQGGSIAIGTNSGHNNNSHTTVVGADSGNNSMSGQHNSLFGYYTGKSLSSGQGNTFIGATSGYVVTTGSNNTLLGFGAGYSAITTGSNNIIIGTYAGTTYSNYSNKLYIHSANGFNVSPLIYGEFDNRKLIIDGDLGIGTGTINSATQLDLQATDKGLGLNNVAGTGSIGTSRNGMLWYDSTNHKYRGVQNGGYVDLISGSLTNNFIPISNGTGGLVNSLLRQFTPSTTPVLALPTDGALYVMNTANNGVLTSRLEASSSQDFILLRSNGAYAGLQHDIGGYFQIRQTYSTISSPLLSSLTGGVYSFLAREGGLIISPNAYNSTLNSACALQLDSTSKGLGLNNIPGAGSIGTGRNGMLWYDSTNHKYRGVQNGGYVDLISGSLTNNFIPRSNSGVLENSYIQEITGNVGGTNGATRPYPLVNISPSGTASGQSGYLKWVDNGINTGKLFIYKPYTNGQGAGWYEILDSQNSVFPSLSTSVSAIGMGLSTMTNSTSSVPTNLFIGEVRNLRVGSLLYGLGVFQGGAGFNYLKPFGGNQWEFRSNVNSYMRDWDWEIIGATANSGKGGGNNTLSNVSKIGNSTVKFRAMANTNSPYYYLEGVFKVNSSGSITSLQITQPSSNTTAFNAVITDTRIQFTGNAFSIAYVICEKIGGEFYGDLYTTPYENERYSADTTVKYWAGSGGFALGSATINGNTQLELQATDKGLGLNLVTSATLAGISASTRKGNLLFDSTANVLKVSNGSSWDSLNIRMSANTVKVNNTTSMADAVDLNIPSNTVLGRTSGNIETLSLQEIIVSTAQLVGGSFTLTDSRLTMNSIVTGIACSSTGVIGTTPIRWTPNDGSMLFSTGVGTDTVAFAYTIYI